LGAEVVAVVDPRRERAEALASGHAPAHAFTSLEECLAGTASDVVHVCAGQDHAALSALALRAGRHVLVVKPAARSAAEARMLLGLRGEAGCGLCPIHQFTFQRGFRHVLERRSELGPLLRVAGTVYTSGAEDLPEVEGRRVLVELTPHFVSLFRALVGP